MFSMELAPKELFKIGDVGAFKTPWEKIAKIAYANVQRHFHIRAGPGGPWAPLKPATWARKKGPRELWETGDMYRSYSSEYGDNYASVFSASPIAPFHDYGTRFMVARSFLWLDVDAMRKIDDEILNLWEFSRENA